MKRRRLLRGFSTASALALAGCLADDLADDDQLATDEPAETASPTDATATLSETPNDYLTPPSPTPSGVTDQSLTVTDSGCGSQTDEASVSFDADAELVTADGTVWGNDACYTAVLSAVSLDGDTLSLTVTSESDAGTDTMCAECITEIDYEASVTLDGGLPETVTVVHAHGDEETTVTEATR